MTGPPAATAAVRSALRDALATHNLGGSTVIVACSGGADSLALALATSFVLARERGESRVVVVDHQLQPGSRDVAHAAAQQCRSLGLETAVVPVLVDDTATGVEDAARVARYTALTAAARAWGATAVLTAHTRNDQAEQVLLGLARGSGARSLSGMPVARVLDGPSPDRGLAGAQNPTRSSAVWLIRPFLAVDRATTVAACAEAGLHPWRDPHNTDPRFARVRARGLLGRIEADLGPGTTQALARSADLLRTDADALELLSESACEDLGPSPWPVDALAAYPEAMRTRMVRLAVLRAGSPTGSLRAEHLRAVDGLLTRWRGQGPIDLPGHVQVSRRAGRIWIETADSD